MTAVGLHKGIGCANELDTFTANHRFGDVVDGLGRQEVQAVLIAPCRVEVGLGHRVICVNHKVGHGLSSRAHFQFVFVHEPFELVHVAQVLIRRQLNHGFAVVAREFTNARIKINDTMDIVGFEGQGTFHHLIQLKSSRVCHDSATVVLKQVRGKRGPLETHAPLSCHAFLSKRQSASQLTFSLEKPKRNILGGGRNLLLSGLKQNENVFSLHLRNWRRSC